MVSNDRDGRGPVCNTMFQRESVRRPCSQPMSPTAPAPQIPFLVGRTCVVIDALDWPSGRLPHRPAPAYLERQQFDASGQWRNVDGFMPSAAAGSRRLQGPSGHEGDSNACNLPS